MAENIVNFPKGTHLMEFIGPFSEHVVTFSGYEVPYLKGKISDGVYHLFLDGRMGIEGTKEEVEKWIWFIANSMAVAAGFSCHGGGCTPLNYFKRRVIGLSELPK